MLIKSELRSCYCVRLGQKCFQKLILVFCFTVIWERLDLAVIIFLLENRPRTEPTRIFPTGIHWRWHSLFNICFLVGARWWHPMSGDAIVMYANTSEVIWGCAYCSRKLSNQLNQLKEFYDQISHRSNCIYTKLQRSHRLEKQVGAEQQGRFHESNFKWFVYCTNELADVSEIKTEKCISQRTTA